MTLKAKKLDKQGFTIIEVVLVLAIVSIIFLVVFAGVPRLQSSRRDNQRKRDAEFMLAHATSYEGSHGKTLGLAEFENAFSSSPSGDFYNSYIKKENFEDPSGTDYKIASSTPPQNLIEGQIRFMVGNQCDEDSDTYIRSTGHNGDFLVLMGTETDVYCIDSGDSPG